MFSARSYAVLGVALWAIALTLSLYGVKGTWPWQINEAGLLFSIVVLVLTPSSEDKT